MASRTPGLRPLHRVLNSFLDVFRPSKESTGRSPSPPHQRAPRLEPLEDRRMLSVLFVDDDAVSGGDGLSWGSAFDDLQDALSQAAVRNADDVTTNNVDQIWIAKGVYKPSAKLDAGDARSASFSLLDGVTLYGGFAGTEATLAERDWSAHETVLSGDLGVVDDSSDNAYTVVYCGENVAAAVDGVSVTGGNADKTTSDNTFENCGGGIYNVGTLTVANSTISGNSAKNAGGGICSFSGTLTVTNSTISGNSAVENGGGMSISGTLTVTNSTISGNSAVEDGGGMSISGAVTVTNSTLVGNSALEDGGAIRNRGMLTVTNSTLVSNSAGYCGGGICGKGAMTLDNSVFWQNVGGDLEDFGTDISPSRNLIGVDPRFVRDPSDGGDGWGDNPDTPDVDESTNDDFGDLRLTSESPAIDYGDAALAVDADGAPLVTDFDGNPRICSTTVDVGACEFQDNPSAGREDASLTVTTPQDVVDLYDDRTSLREAIYYAGTNSLGTTITFAGALDGATITLGGTELWIDLGLTIDASSLSLTIDADQSSRVFSVVTSEEDAVVLNHLTIVDGLADYGGGGIRNFGTLTVTNSTLSGNATAYGDGGGILNDGTLMVTDSTLSDNNAIIGWDADGGGIHHNSGMLTVTNSTFSGNSASRHGGGICNFGLFYDAGSAVNRSTAIVTNSTFIGNSANGYGGGVCNYLGTLTLANSTLSGNFANHGGAIGNYDDYHDLNTMTVMNSTLAGNAAADTGGGIYSKHVLTLNNSIIAKNTAPAEPDLYHYNDSSGGFVVSHNLIGDGARLSGLAGFSGNLVGTAEAPIDPKFVRNPSHGGDGWGDDPDTPDIDESANDDYGDLRLQPGSPAVDAGNNALAVDALGAPLTTDLFGHPRILDGDQDGTATVDMGALEYVPPTIPAFDPIPEITIDEHVPVDFFAHATDPEGPLTYTLIGAPVGAAIDTDTGRFTWTPGETDGPGDFTFQISATDTMGYTGYVDVTIHVSEVNDPHQINPIGSRSVDEFEPVDLTVTVTDTDLPEQTMTFALGPGAPAGAAIDPLTGRFTWTPGEADGPGVYPIEVIVTDDLGLAETTRFNIHVNELNGPPILAEIDDITLNELETATFTAAATDADIPAQTVTFSLAGGNPRGAVIDPDTGEFNWTTSETHGPGAYVFTVVATDEFGVFDVETVTIHVSEVNEAPILDSPSDLTVNEHETATFTVTATDADVPSQSLTYSLGTNAPADAAIDPNTGEFSWTPGETDGPGDFTFQVIATDAAGASDAVDVTIHVAEVNVPPILDCGTEAAVNEWETLMFTVTATDADLPAQELTFSLAGDVPNGASIDPDSGWFMFDTDERHGPGEYTFQVCVTDEAGSTDAVEITIHVDEVNDPHLIDPIGDLTVDELEPVNLTVVVEDIDLPVQAMTFALGPGAPDGAAIDSVTGRFTWTPGEADGPGVFPIEVVVTDEYGLAKTAQFNIHVREVNEAPTLDPIDEITVGEHETASFTATASDADLPVQALTFSLDSTAPTNATIDPATGEIRWTPGEVDGPGDFTFQVIATDDAGASDSVDVTIHVLEVSQPPVLEPIPALTIDEKTTAAFLARATDGDLPAQALTYSLGPTAPAGAAIDPVTGQFLWTPEETDGPGDFTFHVVATDSMGVSGAVDVTIHVLEVNEPPVLAPVRDRNVFVGRAATFTATATDSDLPAQVITYTLGDSAPRYATLDPQTGEFRWTPRPTDVNRTFTFDILATDSTGSKDSQTVSLSVLSPNGETGYVVTSLDDVIAIDGWVTLREALAAANGNEPVGDVQGGSADFVETITFDPALFADGSRVLSIQEGEFRITGDVIIEGPGADMLTIDAHQGSRVFSVASDVASTISDMALTGGTAYDGGAIYNAGSLTLSDTVLIMNTAHRGGTIYNHLGELTLRDTFLSRNSAKQGGAICDYRGEITIVGGELSGNTAERNGGAILLESSSATELVAVAIVGNTAGQNGGGLFNTQGDVALTNVLMHGNRATYNGGGLYNHSGNVAVRQSTVAGNTAEGTRAISSFGGGIYNATGSLQLVGSIIAGNSADVANDLSGFAPNMIVEETIVADTHYRCIDGILVTKTIDPDLLFANDPLATINPIAATRLAANSPAIDAADASSLPNDSFDLDADGIVQEPLPIDLLGADRVRGNGLDLGALESTFAVDNAIEPPRLLGDLNGDGTVNTADLDLIRGNWGSAVTPGDLLAGDASGDGAVGADDVDIVRANWGAVPVAAADAVFDSIAERNDKSVYGPARREATTLLGGKGALSARQLEALAWETWNRERRRI